VRLEHLLDLELVFEDLALECNLLEFREIRTCLAGFLKSDEHRHLLTEKMCLKQLDVIEVCDL
jgi:hypothetical protein